MRVFVSATSIVSGGSLNILKQFILNCKSSVDFIIAINSKLELEPEYTNKTNVSFIKVVENSRLDRVKWDFFKAKKEISKLEGDVCLVISLQNTTLNVGEIRQMVYVHQGLFLHETSWNPLVANERKYAFYKYIYPQFIFAFSKSNTQFIVQTEWMRNALINKYRVPKYNVFNFKPEIVPWSDKELLSVDTNNDELTLFYPATGEVFKNHLLLLESIKLLSHKYSLLNKSLNLKATFTLDVNPEINTHIHNYLEENPSVRQFCEFTGPISYDQVKSYYDSCDVVTFSSSIESFGLPLLEAAMLGKHVLSLDTGFAKEVLKGYEGVDFIEDDPSLWAEHLNQLLENGISHNPRFVPKYQTSWYDFFELM
ncbi:glycosyltransferase [Vibrio sp. ZSDZ34]|uniref:Glycosyltransferase n=1 Tax=Vibrio gelatinilyticus TaxID=2893468 RepID=A0A9X1WI81_9VIBR|nr:glycosyltransferase [Vibrio gelatinilyticus]MCJ2378630.1 glycosyltransferase [Vibrio gelatinilyticus]